VKQDKFLVGILAFIGVLVAVALMLFFLRKNTVVYRAADTPDNVVYNFALAIQQNDLARAYGDLADLDGKPTRAAFLQASQNGYLNVSGNALQVGKVTMQGPDDAWVDVIIQYLGSGPFASGYSNQGRAVLVRQNGAWKISSMPYPYWSGDWYLPTPAPTLVPGKQP
jgi:hypothetical protein